MCVLERKYASVGFQFQFICAGLLLGSLLTFFNLNQGPHALRHCGKRRPKKLHMLHWLIIETDCENKKKQNHEIFKKILQPIKKVSEMFKPKITFVCMCACT